MGKRGSEACLAKASFHSCADNLLQGLRLGKGNLMSSSKSSDDGKAGLQKTVPESRLLELLEAAGRLFGSLWRAPGGFWKVLEAP